MASGTGPENRLRGYDLASGFLRPWWEAPAPSPGPSHGAAGQAAEQQASWPKLDIVIPKSIAVQAVLQSRTCFKHRYAAPILVSLVWSQGGSWIAVGHKIPTFVANESIYKSIVNS